MRGGCTVAWNIITCWRRVHVCSHKNICTFARTPPHTHTHKSTSICMRSAWQRGARPRGWFLPPDMPNKRWINLSAAETKLIGTTRAAGETAVDPSYVFRATDWNTISGEYRMNCHRELQEIRRRWTAGRGRVHLSNWGKCTWTLPVEGGGDSGQFLTRNNFLNGPGIAVNWRSVAESFPYVRILKARLMSAKRGWSCALDDTSLPGEIDLL